MPGVSEMDLRDVTPGDAPSVTDGFPALPGRTNQSTHPPDDDSSAQESAMDEANDLEARLRSLIMSNGIPQQASNASAQTAHQLSHPSQVDLPPHMRMAEPAAQEEYLMKMKQSSTVSNVPAPSAPAQSPRKKPNQAQRRQLKSQFEIQPSAGSVADNVGGVSTRRSNDRGASYQQTHLTHRQGLPLQQQDRGAHQQNWPVSQQHVSRGSPTQQQGRLPFQQRRTAHQLSSGSNPVSKPPLPRAMQTPNASLMPPSLPCHQPRHSDNRYNLHQGPIQQGQYRKPPPQNSQLYEPPVNGLSRYPQQRGPMYNPLSPSAIQAQVEYINQVAEVEIQKAEMDPQDLQEKENLRLLLQRICRSAIADYERQNLVIFDEGSVTLKCFGSLSSGFATFGSDMDLALVSPSSKPDIASPESEVPRVLEKALLDLGYGARLLTRTRVPIIKFCEKPTPELVDALKKARGEWEKERDEPPKPKMSKAPRKSKKEKCQMKANKTVEQVASKEARGSTDGKAIEQLPVSELLQTSLIAEQPDPDVDVPIGRRRAAVLATEAFDEGHENADRNGEVILVPPINVKEGQEEGEENGEEEETHRSDEELVRLYLLAISEGWFEEEERKLVSQFAAAVDLYGSGGDDSELAAARLRLETISHVLKRYREPPDTHMDFPKFGIGIQCDINFSNHLALHNTLLLRCYSHCDPRVRLAVLFVKAWAKRRKINSPYHGTLSSYGYVLMVLHYLINIAQPPLVPNLQLAWRPPQQGSWTTALDETTVDGYDVRFWRSEREIQDLARRGMLTHNRETVGSLLRGFFHYFAVNGPYVPCGGFSWTQDVLSLRTPGGLLSKQEKGWTGAKTTVTEPIAAGQQGREVRHRYLFAIEDPFEIDHNIARTVIHDGIVAVRDEFRRAHRIIQRAGMGNADPMEDLFAEGEERETRQRRAFGPLPPPPGPKKESISKMGPGGEQSKLDAGRPQDGKASAPPGPDLAETKDFEKAVRGTPRGGQTEAMDTTGNPSHTEALNPPKADVGAADDQIVEAAAGKTSAPEADVD
ncbi:Zinc finger, CCHC domain-containing protein [Hypocenomyce scalaris]|nr:Zinc finger, CCHC domain-containing protein [Hypocenomyce scalaris]